MVSRGDFRHDGPGTSTEAWTTALATRPMAPLMLPITRTRLVVAGAHPDDETLGAGGLIFTAALAGWTIDIVTATAGEGSHPDSSTHDPQRLGEVRRAELRDAMAVLAPDASVQCLDLPDGDVASHVSDLVAALVRTIGTDGDDVLLCAPWRHDSHPDHEAVARAAAITAARTDAQLLEYPIWLWHWGGADDLPSPQTRKLSLDAAALEAKARAVAAHASQVSALSDAPGDEVLLHPGVLAHFGRDEVFISSDEQVVDDALDLVHRVRSDPWQVDSPYERRKRALTLASLPRERYARVLEVGCSVGALAVDLAARCDELVALDDSPTAVDLARRRTAALRHVDVRRARVPLAWPEGSFDLVSISEIGYFLSPRELANLVARAREALTDDGHLLLCHWRHQPIGWPLAGPAVHEAFLATGADVLVELDEPDFLLHVLGRPS